MHTRPYARLLLTSNSEQLHATARSEYGVALLHELQSVTRIACLGAGASGSLAASHITQVFRATGSGMAQPGPYAAIGLGIESVLPHDVALRVFRELVASVTAVRAMPIGVAMEACLVTQGSSSSASSVDAASTIVQFVAAIRGNLFARLRMDAGGASSSGGGASSSIPTTIAYEVVTPPAPLLDPNQSLMWNLAHQFEGRLERPLSLGEHVALHEGMGAALAVHVAGSADTRRSILESPLLVAMSTGGVLQLLACVQEALAEAGPPQLTDLWMDEIIQAVSGRCTAIAALSVGELDARELLSPSELDGMDAGTAGMGGMGPV